MPHIEDGRTWLLGGVDIAVGPATAREDMAAVRSALRERSESEARIQGLGMLSDGTASKIWQGGASLKKRLDSGELNQADVEGCFGKLKRHFVPVTEGAPRRCVEDRSVVDYDANDPRSLVLGPQFQGGTVDEAYAYRLVQIMHGESAEGATIAGDVESVMSRDSRYAPGDHDDDHHGAGKLGCGSVDCAEVKNERLATDPEVAEAAVNKTHAIFDLAGVEMPDGFGNALVAATAEIAQHAPHYFDNASEAFSSIRQRCPEGMPTVSGSHFPGSLTLNFTPDTTFDTSSYNQDTSGRLYNFNLDVWAIIGEFGSEEAATIVAQAVNTLTNLTDGSLRLFARLPEAA